MRLHCHCAVFNPELGAFKRVFEKHQEQVSRLSMKRIVARSIMVSEVCTMYS